MNCLLFHAFLMLVLRWVAVNLPSLLLKSYYSIPMGHRNRHHLVHSSVGQQLCVRALEELV